MKKTIYKIKAIDSGGYVTQDFETMSEAEIYILNFIPHKFWHKVKIELKQNTERVGS